MSNFKRMRISLLALILVSLAIPALAQPLALREEDFVLDFLGESYRLGEDAGPLVTAVEAAFGPMSVLEIESCRFFGIDREYESEELVIATYPIGADQGDVIETLMVIGGESKTARGIGIGSTRQEVLDAYGDEYAFDYDQLIYGLTELIDEPVLVFELDLATDTVAMFYMRNNTQ